MFDQAVVNGVESKLHPCEEEKLWSQREQSFSHGFGLRDNSGPSGVSPIYGLLLLGFSGICVSRRSAKDAVAVGQNNLLSAGHFGAILSRIAVHSDLISHL